jgi:hypothetical protein
MPIKGGLPKDTVGDRSEREAFIAGGRGKETLPWEAPHVRSDVMVQVNVKQPEDLNLQLEWLVQHREAPNKRQLIEDLLREGVAARLKRRGITS